MEHLQIRMLGDFSLQSGDRQISFGDGRSKKVWLLLAYILCRRGRLIPRKELINLLWSSESSSNPESALKTTFHRVRALLNQLWPDAGHQLILWTGRGYTWNTEIPLDIDADTFDRLCRKDNKSEEQWIQDSLEALTLYQGEFLSNLTSETWIIPLAAYYHNLYIQTLLDLAPLLLAHGRSQEAADICRNALAFEPYHEPLHRLLMQALLELGDLKSVSVVYDALSKRLFSELGIQPSEETKAIYRATAKSIHDQSLPMEAVLEYLRETDAKAGALQCEFDYFKVLCYAEVRAMHRSGKVTHIALLSAEKNLSQKSLEKIMEQLGEQIRLNLRRGDVFSRCSKSQYILMLPEANYENSCMVCRRVLNAYAKRFPSTTAKINFVVQPLESGF